MRTYLKYFVLYIEGEVGISSLRLDLTLKECMVMAMELGINQLKCPANTMTP